MGKNLVIKGADFSENCVDNIYFDVLTPFTVSVNGWNAHISNEQEANYGIRHYIPFATKNLRKVYIFDVSDYIGDTITVVRDVPKKAGTGSETSAAWSFFISDLPTGLTESILQTLPVAEPTFSVDSVLTGSLNDGLNSENKFNEKTEVTVPANSKYIVIGIPVAGGSSDPVEWNSVVKVLKNKD